MRLPAGLDRLDLAVDRQLEHLRGGPLDVVVYRLSESANHSMLWHALGATSALGPGGRARWAVETSVVLGIESALVNGLLKSVVRRPRPTAREHLHRLRTPLTSSFPSGHASSAFTAAAVLSHRRPGWRRPLVALATTVAVSRAWVGIHHLSDVVGGVVVGVAIGEVAVRALDRLDDTLDDRLDGRRTGGAGAGSPSGGGSPPA